MASGLSINNVVITIVALAIGICLLGSLLAPIASDVITAFSSGRYGSDGTTWATLVGVVVIFAIVGLLIVALNSYTNNREK